MVYSLQLPVRPPYLKTAVVGVSGYTGLQLVNLLADHPVLSLGRVCAHSFAGEPLAQSWPHLAGHTSLAEVVIDEATLERLEGFDVVFLATPHEPAAHLGVPLAAQGTLVVDLSGGHRLEPVQMEAWYDFTHPYPDHLPATYGLPELVDLSGVRLIAGPGCYPTATLIALAPFLGQIDPTSIVITGMSGISGAGRVLSDPFSFIGASANTRPYGAPGHRHTAEIERILGELGGRDQPPVSFIPHIVPQATGLLCTVTAQLTDTVDPLARLHDTYAGQPFIHVSEPWPETRWVIGSNRAVVSARVDQRTGRLITACAIDNTIKGAAGQAIQAANVALGLDQTLGLPTRPPYL